MIRIFNWIQERPFLSALLGLTALAVGGYFGADAIKEREWAEYSAKARARGVAITLEEIIPPPVPDAENFAALPLFQRAFAEPSTPVKLIPKLSGPLPGLGNALKREPVPWKKWQEHLQAIGWLRAPSETPARDILQALDEHALLMKEWNEGLVRPKTRFPLNYEAGLGMVLPHLGLFQDATQLHGLRIHASLELGDAAAALAEWQRGLATLQKLDEEPILIQHLIRTFTLTLLLDAVGAGLEQRRWNEPQLRQIIQELARIDLLRSRQLANDGERAMMNSVYELLAKSDPKGRERLLAGLGNDIQEGLGLLRLIPRRMIRDNQLRHNRYFDELDAKVNWEKGTFDSEAPTPSLAVAATPAEKFYYLIFYLTAPVYASVDHRWAMLRIKVDQCRAACALEGFRQTHGKYPEALQELVPQWLERVPADPFAGRPMIYRLTENQYLLYSVGAGGVDDQAAAKLEKSETKQPDIIWRQIPRAQAGPVTP